MFLEPNGKMLQEISDLIEQVYLCPYFGFLELLPFMCWCAPLLMMTGKCLSLCLPHTLLQFSRSFWLRFDAHHERSWNVCIAGKVEMHQG